MEKFFQNLLKFILVPQNALACIVSAIVLFVVIRKLFSNARKALFEHFTRFNGFTLEPVQYAESQIVDPSLDLFKNTECTVSRAVGKSVEEGTNVFIADVCKYSYIPLFGGGRRRSIFPNRNGENIHEIGSFRFSKGSETVFCVCSEKLVLPQAFLYPETIIEKGIAALGGQDIDFDDDPVFSNKFTLQGESEGNIREFFGPTLRRELSKIVPSNVIVEMSENKIMLHTGYPVTYGNCIFFSGLAVKLYNLFSIYEPVSDSLDNENLLDS